MGGGSDPKRGRGEDGGYQTVKESEGGEGYLTLARRRIESLLESYGCSLDGISSTDGMGWV